MTNVTIAGAGAFGTSLAIARAQSGRVTTLWARDDAAAERMAASRENTAYLSGARFPPELRASSATGALGEAAIVLLAIPTQNLRGFLERHQDALAGKTCIVCCKGIEKSTGELPTGILNAVVPSAVSAVLTGPGFAAEIARGLPTALTLAISGEPDADLQAELSTATLRLYLSRDPVGAQLGGALKNVFAIACGIAIGAGLGESARAALMSRGYAEMMRLAVDMGASPATLAGLSGLGDLALTCTSPQSRNYSLGLALGQGGERRKGTTFEGVATARATLTLAKRRGIDMPITAIVAAVMARDMTIPQSVDALMSRPLTSET